MIRKSTRIRIYVAFLTFVYVGAFSVLLWRQGRAYQARFDRLEASFNDRISSLQSAAVDRPVLVASGSEASSPAPSPVDIPRFIVLGHGRCSRWGYIDIQYVCDGDVDRFYYNADSIRGIPDDIEREVFRHEYGLAPSRSLRYSSASLPPDDFASDYAN